MRSTHEIHAYEMHAYKTYAHEMQALYMPIPCTGNISSSLSRIYLPG
jgi:hypothetical protein